jgi:dipeptidase E
MCIFDLCEFIVKITIMKQLLIASSSSIHGSGYLEYLQPALEVFFKGVQNILFLPYARPQGISFDSYTEIAQQGFDFMGIKVTGIHSFDDPILAIEKAEAVFVGGGNTFVLVATLCQKGLMTPLKTAVEAGLLYLGTSAGSNICGPTMQTTNDMPIVYPTSLKTLASIPFNINAHYLDPDPASTHRGESRKTRIQEFHEFNELSVLGLREGSWLQVAGNSIVLKGTHKAPLFQKGKERIDCNSETEFSFLR